MSDAQEQQRREWELRRGRSATTEGVVMVVDWANRLVTVNVGGVEQSMPWHGPAPWVADRVRVITAGQRPVCSLVEGSAQGTVITVAGGRASVTGDDGKPYLYPYLGPAPSSGARVRLDHAARVIVGVYSAEPTGSEFVPPPVPPVASGSAWFDPIWSGNWSDGVFASDNAEVSISRAAAYGYGTAIADTIRNDMTITRAELHLVQVWDRESGVPSSMGLHGHVGRPSGFSNADVSGEILVGSGSFAVDLRGIFADALKNGAAFGVGFRSGAHGWRRYNIAPLSGRIYMEWSG